MSLKIIYIIFLLFFFRPFINLKVFLLLAQINLKLPPCQQIVCRAILVIFIYYTLIYKLFYTLLDNKLLDLCN